jgi:hypothetical protein
MYADSEFLAIEQILPETGSLASNIL